MLWQKESDASNATYIDLCTPSSPKEIKEFERAISLYDERMQNSVEKNFVASKDNDLSLKLRREGNALFTNKKWDQAMDKYNRSLCYAEKGSEQIALAYANRSSCYLYMKMYDKCLVDIDLARKANYPEYLEPKLNKRAADCVKSIDDGLQAIDGEAKLSYESHQNYPGLVEHLVIVNSSKHGRGVFATKDVDVGETVLLERMYVGESFVRKYETCTVCLKSNTNLAPCSTCTFAMLCYDGCNCADLHRLECGIRSHPNNGDDFVLGILISVIRSILMAMKLFSNTDDLMCFVEEAIAADPMEIPLTVDDKSTYRSFLKIHKEELTDARPHHIHFFYRYLAGNTELASHFSEEKHRRFYMHLIMHHLAVVKSNKITSERLVGNVLPAGLNALDYVYEDESIGILKTYFNHSCAPNIAFYCDNGCIIGKIIRPVKNGEQLFCSYFPNLLGLTWDDRRGMNDFGFECDCFRCESGVTDNTDFHIDPAFGFNGDYLYLRANFSPNRSYPEEPIRKAVEEKCVTLLKKFGRNKWTYSLEYVMQAYVAALQRSSTSPISKYLYLENIVHKHGLNHNVDLFEQDFRQKLTSLFSCLF
ncbi:uncharacterized protein LOC119085756 [Bradysia coprophila]|uniref:uncharacterized protein LOC119085756 n=1 Tax=Bradysia coprophila TaxID=38358 RepID=UPI00187DD440|nr:uncharacterized protein LOC119085756 [Bradysia coprophila]